ncbi:MAG TPA: tyrosine-type recombinase/integrase [Chthoniobacterales bacterium]|nr:tyrosine-type recombinase/integrase [Chthoniobacterales bacterium]
MASIWRHPQSKYFTACFRDHNGRQRRISTKETNRKNAQKLADEYEKASRTKRTLRQAQAVLDRLHEELSGEKIVRISFRRCLNDWLKAKEAETARTTMTFYRGSLNKFVLFLGDRSDQPIREITKQDVVAFRNSLMKQISAKTANHDLKALKMMFKSARRDSVITEDPTEFVESIRRERVSKIKRPFTLAELRSILDLTSDEWRSMILFGLYSGQRLGDIATLRWNNIDLQRNELRLSTRKTGKAIILPLAAPLRKHISSLNFAGDPSAPIHPKAFDLVERQHKTGNLSNQFADLLASAGLREKKNHKGIGKGRGSRRDVEPLSFHSLRRTATTILHEAGVPAAVAQALIGHDSEAMHELYVSVGHEALRKAAAALPEI